MLFMVIERFRQGDARPIGERFKRRRRMLPEGVALPRQWGGFDGQPLFSRLMLAAPRMTFALGQGGRLPKVFAHVQRRFRTPGFSIAFYPPVALVLALSGRSVQMAAVGAVAWLVHYAATCAVVPMLRLKRGLMPDAWQLPWGATIPVLGLLASLFIIAGADANSLMLRAIAFVVDAGFYGVQSFGRRKDR